MVVSPTSPKRTPPRLGETLLGTIDHSLPFADTYSFFSSWLRRHVSLDFQMFFCPDVSANVLVLDLCCPLVPMAHQKAVQVHRGVSDRVPDLHGGGHWLCAPGSELSADSECVCQAISKMVTWYRLIHACKSHA